MHNLLPESRYVQTLSEITLCNVM